MYNSAKSDVTSRLCPGCPAQHNQRAEITSGSLGRLKSLLCALQRNDRNGSFCCLQSPQAGAGTCSAALAFADVSRNLRNSPPCKKCQASHSSSFSAVILYLFVHLLASIHNVYVCITPFSPTNRREQHDSGSDLRHAGLPEACTEHLLNGSEVGNRQICIKGV